MAEIGSLAGGGIVPMDVGAWGAGDSVLFV
jgi:hypothetical protein